MKLLTVVLFVGLFLFAMVLLLVVIVAWPPQMGLDFTGGVRLVYEVDLDALENDEEADHSLAAIDMSKLVQTLTYRVNPSETKEAIVRRCDEWQVEIIVPKADPLEMDRIKKWISTSGSLRLRIVANKACARHQHAIALAEEQSKDAARRHSRYVKDADVIVGYWARVGRSTPTRGGVRPFRVQVAGDVIRNANTGELIQLPAAFDAGREHALERYLTEQGIEEVDVLVIVDKDLSLNGEHLGNVSRGYDETMRPCIRFLMRKEGAKLMARLTGGNLPDRQRNTYQKLAILLDGEVLSAPRIMSTISDCGQITGDFTVEEVDFIVGILRAGTLPVLLRDAPISETAYPFSEAVWRTVRLTVTITLGALLLIWLLMLFRYGIMGLGSSLASLLQLLLMVVVIEVFRGVVTMPLIYAATAVLLLAVVGNAVICESVRRRSRDEQTSPASIWRSFLLSAVPFAILLGALCIAGLVAYVVGDFPLRNAAFPVVTGAMAALATSCVCLLAPVGLVAARFQPAADCANAPIRSIE